MKKSKNCNLIKPEIYLIKLKKIGTQQLTRVHEKTVGDQIMQLPPPQVKGILTSNVVFYRILMLL